MIFHLQTPEQASALMAKIWPKVKDSLKAGKLLRMEIKAQSRSEEQNAKYHAMLSEIATQAQHLGAKWSAEDWKRLLVDLFAKETGLQGGKIIPSLDSNGIVQLGLQTRDFTKEQAMEFITFLEAWGANNGIIFKDVAQDV
jgi:NinB protein